MLDDASRFYTGGVGVAARDALVPDGAEGVLVVEGCVADADEQVAGREAVEGEAFDGASKAAVGLADNEGSVVGWRHFRVLLLFAFGVISANERWMVRGQG